MKINTHREIDGNLCGQVLETAPNRARVELHTTRDMAVDDYGLVHGGFIFGAADHAAMIAVNHPNVVLAGADVKFLKPVIQGETVIAEAEIIEADGKKNVVHATVYRDADKVFTGRFDCYVLDKHVLADGKK